MDSKTKGVNKTMVSLSPKTKKISHFIISIVTICIIIILTRDSWFNVELLTQIKWSTLLILSASFIFFQLINGYKLKIMLSIFNIPLNFSEWFGLVSIRSLGNYLPLSSGSILNSIYLKKNKNLPYSLFLSLYSVNILFLFISIGITGVVLSTYKSIYNSEYTYSIFLFLLLIILNLFIFYFDFSKFFTNPKNKFSKTLANINQGIKLVKTNNILIFKLLILNFVSIFVTALRIFIIYKALGFMLLFTDVYLIILFLPFLSLVNIIPGNLGIRESIIGSLSYFFDLSFNSGFAVGVVDRIIILFWLFIFGFFYNFYLSDKILFSSDK